MEIVPAKQKTVAFLVARLTSSRLPSKQLRRIGDRSLLDWVLTRLRQSLEVDEIVLATVDEPANQPLKEFARRQGIACFWYKGEVDHVTTRLRRAAEHYEAEICVLVSGDCPLIHAPAIDRMVRSLKDDAIADVVRLPAGPDSRPPALQGVVIARKKAWQLADDLADRPELKEHQFPVIGLRPELFNFIDVRLPDNLYMPHHRLSVDTVADLEFMNALYHRLAVSTQPYDLPHVATCLSQQPELKQINRHVHQRQLIEQIKRVLFVVDAGGPYGFGHLMRCMELARQITERLGWPTHFMIDDQQAMQRIQAMGHQIHWGAFARSANSGQGQALQTIDNLSSVYDLIIIDIFDQRSPDLRWRRQIGEATRCVIIENALDWARQADLIVIPNVLDKVAASRPPGKISSKTGAAPTTGSKIVGGAPFIILRNRVRRLAAQLPDKDLDLLIYLHDRQRRHSIRTILSRLGLSHKIMDGFEPGFAEDLARARFFISGFGISFYEALALKTLPVCWPDSDVHHDDACQFYRQMDMDPLIIESATDMETTIGRLIDRSIVVPKPIQDGTPSIVAEIAALFQPS